MNQSIFTKTILGALLMISMGLTACAKKDSAAAKVAGRGGSITTSATCSSGQAATGYVTSSNLEQATKILVTATLPASSFGRIQQDGVKMTLNLKANSAGQVSTAASVLFEITDSFVGQTDNGKVIQPYNIELKSVVSGSVNTSSRTFNVVFQDEYGVMQIQGSYNNSLATGAVVFQNYKSVDTSVAANQVVTLGTFKIPSCSLFN
ncbi:MAG: hypothetical protein J7501_16375 [Bdellovibrio sp.]|nr:hypothetical protein [Bdellovibrio sp.]